MSVEAAAKSSVMSIEPHGGKLVNRLVCGAERGRIRERARDLVRVDLDARGTSDMVLLGVGGFSPHEGFMGKADYESVVREGRLANGLPWTIPVTLPVSRELADKIKLESEVALYSDAGNLIGTMEVREKYAFDKEAEAKGVFLTTEDKHPGVAYLKTIGDVLLAGPIRLLEVPALDPAFQNYFLYPSETRYLFQKKGWKTVVAFQTRNPIHRAHEYIQRCALETVDGLLLHPLVGQTKGDDIPAPLRMKCYLALLENYYPKDRVVLSVFPAAMRYAGPREAIFHALVRKNFGCTHIIIGRDHAGVGNYYGTYDAQRIFERYHPEEIGIRPMCFDFTFHCKKCGHIVSDKTCGHSAEDRLHFSGTKVREMLRAGQNLPVEFTRPEIASILVEAYKQTGA